MLLGFRRASDVASIAAVNRTTSLLASLALPLSLGALHLGCSAGADDTSLTTGSGGGSSSGPGATTGTDSGSASTFSAGTGVGGGSGECLTCSADLHSVIRCDGTVVQACAPDQGCSPTGTCVPACQAAAENKSTYGCDFYSVTPAIIAEARGSCFAMLVANTWSAPISVQASYAGQTIDASQYMYLPQGNGSSYQPLGAGNQLQPGQLGILFLSKYESGDIFQTDCPVQQWLEMPTQTDATGIQNAFHVTTTAPIVSYDVYPWGGASSFATSATLLLPTPTWGDNFVTADAWEGGFGQPFTQIVASQDGTTVTMVPITTLQGGGSLPSAPANTPVTFTLNAGQVAQYVQDERLAGSTLQADKPVSVWGGATCMNIPDTNTVACDAAHQQLLPVQSLGSEYVVARYPSRGGNDSAPVTLIGMVDGSTLTFDPPLGGAPGSLSRGQRAVVYADQPFSVKSQDKDHPFYVGAHMTGAATNAENIGDPEWVNVVPPGQYLPSYLFATDPTYAYTALAFTRKKDESGFFQDVTLDCLGTVTGWQPVGTSGQYEAARFLIVNQFQPVGGCNNGVHTASSATPFGLTVWGYDQAVSYGYPAGMSLETINTVIVPPTPQ